jgi:hypothetical protein
MKARKALDCQRCFAFAAEDSPSAAHVQPATAKQRKPKKVAASSADHNELADLCVLLHDLARKYVSTSNFHDFSVRVRCTKLLESLGVLQSAAEACANAHDHDSTLVMRSPAFRRLRAHVVACLSTVADLSTRAPGKGTPDYQRGMREAFQQASNIAALFLDEVEVQHKVR